MKIYNAMSLFLLSGLFLANSCTDESEVVSRPVVSDSVRRDNLGTQGGVPDLGPSPASNPSPSSGSATAATMVDGHKWHPMDINEKIIPPFQGARKAAEFKPDEDKIIDQVKGTGAIALKVQKVSGSPKEDLDKDGQASKFFIIYDDKDGKINATFGLDGRVHGRDKDAMKDVAKASKKNLPTHFSVEDLKVVTDKDGTEYFMVTLKDLGRLPHNDATLVIKLKDGKALPIYINEALRKSYTEKKPVDAASDLPKTGEMSAYAKELNAPAGDKVVALGNDQEALMIVDGKNVFLRKKEQVPAK